MFITLKRPSADGETEMEQVASRGANSNRDKSRMRLGRRPACLSCQTRKLRCSGRIGDCDRCRANSIACVFPSSQAKHGSHRNDWSVSSTATSRTSRIRGASALPALNTVHEPPNPPKSSSRQEGEDPDASRIRNTGPQGDFMFDMDFDNDMSHLLLDVDALSRANPQIKATDIVSAFNLRNHDAYDSGDLHHGAVSTPVDLHTLYQQAQKPPTPPSVSMPGLSVSDGFSFDSLIATTEPAAEPAIRDLLMDELPNLSPPAPTAEPMMDSATDSPTAWAKNDECPCMSNAVRVVQQLDDDDFRITTLPLNQVLQLQKWIIAQCCKPLDCVRCKFLPTIHTVLVIICDRLTEMFECIHKRLQKDTERISGLSDSSGRSSSASSDSLPSIERSGELYCISSRGPASKANCNPELFSTDLQAMYTSEEQIHVIRVLLKLQIRNFRALLMRAGNASQITGSEARKARIKSMIIRLGRAASDIDSALQAILQFFAAKNPGIA
ncbi:hypothetical protein P168DRAFT_305672 [Aspergillus campestris IBT 28561]|uniref:Zn(2)-C6 fungal-type domain-containing protein n=1 Tax=Aspergillus campestris (strain IBT 28561) TaxID=1392248 RepID=A0A2I1D0J1_ASPC2|nr:uncharacterized protein P168DRAFT_305672 [Aspergillus campestris IBT 28561]PKY03391.1 hypothetical protein P168DRAFT_305672 [Aspergillus campestris IBT 28561]